MHDIHTTLRPRLECPGVDAARRSTAANPIMRDALNGVGVVLDRARAELHSGKYSSRQVKSVLAASHATADGILRQN
jgi:hypothetical protein